MNTAYKFRIYPTKKQIEYFDQCVRSKNFIFNKFLRKQIDISEMFVYTNDPYYTPDENKQYFTDKEACKEARNKYMKDNDLYFNAKSKKITECEKQLKSENSFLKEIDSTIFYRVCLSLEKSFKNMKMIGSGFPRFKKFYKSSYSFSGSMVYDKGELKNFKILKGNKKHNKIKIPKLKQPLKVVIHRKDFIEFYDNCNKYKINSYTISKNNNQYFISIQFDDKQFDKPSEKRVIKKETSLGIDGGSVRPITTSDREDFDDIIFGKSFQLLKIYQEEKTRLQSILNRKRDYHKKNKTGIDFKNTKSYKRVLKKLHKIETTIKNIRENKHYEIVNKLITKPNIDTFIIEDLNIKGMTKKSAKGKSNNKRHMTRGLLDTGLYTLYNKLESKSDLVGKNVVRVHPAHTSQKCSKCGTINSMNRIIQDEFKCINCDFEENADFNAAINIKEKYFFKKDLENKNK